MKNQISFMSGLFDSDRQAHAAQCGKDLAAWLAAKSKGSEFVFGKPVQAASGWSESVTVGGEHFVLGFDLGAKSVDPEYAEWIITIDKPRRFLFFGPKNSASRGRLCDLIHNILRDERFVREVQWSESHTDFAGENAACYIFNFG